ncbi:HD domain-containing phosphohydrolase [Polaromonas sp. AET17H-212]|uniref:HD domain-containing phosphohydrolase n=1 Tax=Polaromonas sp. AET17H-212 TaxID=1977061 RepID=UPI000BBC4048|nr:HD domain-containing phosphohydrolase [Polaromonas sp. AET17H-212]
MNDAAPELDSERTETVRILCVDDEPNILSSLRRLFRTQGYQVLTADGGNAGLTILETESIDLVISDMRMPEMDGAAFLEHVQARWPDTIRLLLTGYADIQSTIEAINRGKIYRYIAKPWDDNDLLLIVRQALERKFLEREKQRLEELTQRQNEELRTLNASLETKVEERTAALTQAHDQLLATNEKLKANFIVSIKIFSSLIEMREARPAGHSARVADLARKLAAKMKLDEAEAQEIFIAALLKDIGKIGFSDGLLSTPIDLMSGDNLGHYRQHPQRAEQLLMPLEDLRGAAKILRSQSERFDGLGYPDSLAENSIPTGARILALATDYDNLQIGALVERCFSPAEAKELILRNAGKRYDPQVIHAFKAVLSDIAQETLGEFVVGSAGLRSGMILARDLLTREGIMMLPADRMLDEHLIRKILDFEAAGGVELTICVRRESRK